MIDARPGTAVAGANQLLDAITRLFATPGRALLLFDPLEEMSDRWGADIASTFFALLPVSARGRAIAYWSLSRGENHDALRRDIEDVAQCILVLRDSRLRIAKAESRPVGVQGSVYHYRESEGGPELTKAPAAARLCGRCVISGS